MNNHNPDKTFGQTYQKFMEIEQIDFPHNVVDLLDSAAEKFGSSEAVTFFERGEALSFIGLKDKSYALAASMAELGVRQGDKVSLMLSNRIDYPIAWLAVAILGAVAVPTITGITPRELRFIINDADVKHIVIEDTFLPVLEASELKGHLQSVVLVGNGETDPQYHLFRDLLAAGANVEPVRANVSSSDLLNIQYTSGTTGLPKGVMQSHRFWVLAGAVPAVMLPEVRNVLSDHPWYYIDPQWMLIMGLYSGARVDFTNGMSIKKFLGWLEARDSHLVWFPDPILKLPETEQDKKNSIKLFMGYHLSPDMQRTIESRYEAPVREFYGMTELSMGLCVPVDSTDPLALGTCGIPAPFRRARIVDEYGRDVAPGCVGELWMSGDGIFSGYYNRPEINQELIVDGWFRTGDLFCQDANGYYNIVGRIKDMIKRSGENIAAIEVEQVLLELAEVEDVAVVAVPDPDRDEEVKAYIKLNPGLTPEALSVELIKSHCSGLLAKFKVPRYIEFVSEFPYTPSNKVAKHLLIKGVDDLRANSYDYVDAVWR